MLAHYFAYGTNLHWPRLRARVPSAQVLGPALLADMRLALDKPGADGSGKANLVAAAGARVWGVVYTFEEVHWAALDACEPGYARVRVSVTCASRALEVQTYVSALRAEAALALSWYKRLIVEGARAHGLPADYLAQLERLPERTAGG